MKRWIHVALICGLAGTAQAQDFDQDAFGRQERLRQQQDRDSGVLRHGSSDARQLNQLQRMRQRSEQRVRRLSQPEQTSRPANTNNSRQNVVKTQ